MVRSWVETETAECDLGDVQLNRKRSLNPTFRALSDRLIGTL